MIRNRRHEQAIETLIETALRAGYATVPKWQIQTWYSMSKLTATVVNDLRARAIDHDTVENPSDLLVFTFRKRDENRDVLLVRSDRLVGGIGDEDEEEIEDVYEEEEDADEGEEDTWDDDLDEPEEEKE